MATEDWTHCELVTWSTITGHRLDFRIADCYGRFVMSREATLASNSAGGPLDGVRVLEVGQVISAPYAGLLLADLGAEVIKIEPPTGDSARNPEVSGFRGKSATFLTLNRNKHSVRLDLADEGGYTAFRDLVAGADVLLTNMVPATAARLRIDPKRLREMNPTLIICRVLGFRSDHPQVDDPSFDLTHQALAGYLTMGGHEGTAPSRVAIPLADLAVAMYSAYAVLAALFDRAKTGLGDDIEVPMYDSLLSMLTYQATLYLNQGELPPRLGSAHPHTAPWQAYQAADVTFVVAARNEKFWLRLCDAVDCPELATDERFRTNQARVQNREALQEQLELRFRTAPASHWLEKLKAARVPAAPVQSIADALEGEVATSSPLIRQFTDPELGPVSIVGNPVRFSRLQLRDPAPAPDLGEDDGLYFDSARVR